MINGQRAEAQKGFAVLKDVDEGTFERLIEWIHMRYYTATGLHFQAGSSPLSSNNRFQLPSIATSYPTSE